VRLKSASKWPFYKICGFDGFIFVFPEGKHKSLTKGRFDFYKNTSYCLLYLQFDFTNLAPGNTNFPMEIENQQSAIGNALPQIPFFSHKTRRFVAVS
jgi:hypothetical protein